MRQLWLKLGITLLLLMLFYLCGVFITFDWNISNWLFLSSEKGRVITVMIVLIFLFGWLSEKITINK